MSELRVSDLEVKSYWLVKPDQFNREIVLERVVHYPDGYRWAVRSNDCSRLNKTGQWEWEPRPGDRKEDFYERCGFSTKEEALAAFNSLK